MKVSGGLWWKERSRNGPKKGKRDIRDLENATTEEKNAKGDNGEALKAEGQRDNYDKAKGEEEWRGETKKRQDQSNNKRKTEMR